MLWNSNKSTLKYHKVEFDLQQYLKLTPLTLTPPKDIQTQHILITTITASHTKHQKANETTMR